MKPKTRIPSWDGIRVRLGETRDIRIKVSETYTSDPVLMPIRVIRGKKSGPTVFISAALHGDEVNGTGIIHELMFSDEFKLLKGTVVLIPVINVLGFESNTRYLPDRRDLNRCFPGSPTGSLASRVAYNVFQTIVKTSDVGIDLHSAASQRTNYPNIRADLSNRRIRELAQAFGCELVVNNKGPANSFRREACRAGCPTIVLEAGESLKMEPSVLDIGYRGVMNVLKFLGMMKGTPIRPSFSATVKSTIWVRAEVGGIVRYHIAPGDYVKKNQPVATNYSILATEQRIVKSPTSGIVLGLATMPAVKPGEPICHIARIPRGVMPPNRSKQNKPPDRLHRKAQTDLATNIIQTHHSQSKTT